MDPIEDVDFNLLKDLKDSKEINKSKEKILNSIKVDNNYSIDKKNNQEIQSRIRAKIYLKRPFKEKKILGRKKKHNEGLGEHNKFSDDNILRKCKNVIMDCVLKFITIDFFKENISLNFLIIFFIN